MFKNTAIYHLAGVTCAKSCTCYDWSINIFIPAKICSVLLPDAHVALLWKKLFAGQLKKKLVLAHQT